MRIGVSLPTSGPFAGPRFIRSFGVACDELGYDGVWASDHATWTFEQAQHHFPVGAVEAWRPDSQPNHFDALTTLSVLAGCTTRVRLGTAVLILPVRNPVLLAKQAAALDQFSDGRVVLGVGVGGSAFADAELGAVGAQHLRRHRGRVTDEWITTMRSVWTDDPCSFRGEFIDADEASIFPKPMRGASIPILVGGDSEPALARAAVLGDGSIVSRLVPADVERRRHELRAAADGRKHEGFEIAVLRWVSLAGDEAAAVAQAEATLRGTTRGADPLAPGAHQLVGAPGRLQEVVAAYAESGVDELILQVIGPTPSAVLETLQRFREEVVAPVATGT